MRARACKGTDAPFLHRSGSRRPSLQSGFPIEARLSFTCLRKSLNNPSPYVMLQMGIMLRYRG